MSSICQNGKLQAPLNIKSEKAIQCEQNCELLFYYRSSICSIINNAGNLIIDYDAGSYVNYKSQVYQLEKISFTIPGSNKIDNHNYPMEMFLWHKSLDVGEILIVSVFIDINEAQSRSKEFFDILSNPLPKYNGRDKIYNTPEDWTVYNAIPELKSFYVYLGSLPQSPCTENVIWIILDNPVNMGHKTYNNIKNIIKKNSRKIQRVNGRVIQYNPNTKAMNTRNYGSKLRCYTDEELRKKCKCMCKNGETQAIYPNVNIPIVLSILIITLFILFVFIGLRMGLFNSLNQSLRDFIRYKPTILQVEN